MAKPLPISSLQLHQDQSLFILLQNNTGYGFAEITGDKFANLSKKRQHLTQITRAKFKEISFDYLMHSEFISRKKRLEAQQEIRRRGGWASSLSSETIGQSVSTH